MRRDRSPVYDTGCHLSVSIDKLTEVLPKSGHGRRVSNHARVVEYEGPIPWLALVKMMKLLPHVRELGMNSKLRGSQNDPFYPPSYPPSHPRSASSMLAASRPVPTLTSLFMKDVQFSSAMDILRLLPAFPLLSRASFWKCTIPSGSNPVLAPRLTHLRDLIFSLTPVAEGEGFAQFWQWPHPAGDPKLGPCPGLQSGEIQMLFTMIRSLSTGS